MFHLACAGETTPWDWIRTAAQRLGLSFEAEPITRSTLGGAYRPERSCLDSTLFQQTWGLRLPPWDEALATALQVLSDPSAAPVA